MRYKKIRRTANKNFGHSIDSVSKYIPAILSLLHTTIIIIIIWLKDMARFTFLILKVFCYSATIKYVKNMLSNKKGNINTLRKLVGK